MKDEDAMNLLAEHVANGKTLGQAARAANISLFRAQALWARICARLGEKATWL